MALIQDVKKNWAAILVIAGIMGGTYLALEKIDARAEEVAKTTVEATVNKAMVDGAKQAAKEAVKEIVPEVTKQAAEAAAKEAVKQLIEAQKAEKAAADTSR